MSRVGKWGRKVQALSQIGPRIVSIVLSYRKRAYLEPFFFTLSRLYSHSATFQTQKDNISHLILLEQKMDLQKKREAFSKVLSSVFHSHLSKTEKDKAGKKESLQKSNIRKMEALAEFKRKLTTLKGQVNEAQIILARKKVDVQREIGAILMKKNSEMRALEIAEKQLREEVELLQFRFSRNSQRMGEKEKDRFITAEEYDRLYVELLEMKDLEKRGSEVFNKVSKSAYQLFLTQGEFHSQENRRLRSLIDEYEKAASSGSNTEGHHGKADVSYENAAN